MESIKEYYLSELIESTRLGGNYSTTNKPNMYPLIKMGNLDRGKIKLNKVEYINSKKINEKDLLKYGDVLLNTRNTPELVGKIAIWRNELKKAYYNSNLMLLKFNRKYIDDNFYMNYIFNTKDFIRKTNSIAIGTTSVAAIYNKDLMKLSIKIVPKKEQKVVSNILSNIDKLIDNLQKIIEKKEKIKQSFMKNYLVGNMKLEGFNGKRKLVKLEDIIEKIIDNRGKTPPTVNSGIPLIEVGALNNTRVDYSKIEKYVSLEVFNNWFRAHLEDNDLLFSTVGTTAETALYSSNIKAGIAQNIIGIRFKNVCKSYMGYLFNTEEIIKTIKKIEMGAVQPSIKVSQMIKLSIPIHENIEEQKSISNILINMDDELDVLYKKLSKYKQIREGMMEELLTGKVRVKDGEYKRIRSKNTRKNITQNI